MTKASFYWIALISIMCLTSCATWPHKFFLEYFDNHVGRSLDDPSNTIKRYPSSVRSIRVLEDGTEEYEKVHLQTREGEILCKVFLRVDPVRRVVISWRYEGKDENCVQ